MPVEASYCMVMTTCANREDARSLAAAVVGERLAACVQMQSVDSVYRWEGRVCQEPEVLVFIKTATARYPELVARIHALHRYDLPEVLRVDIAAGSPDYLVWIGQQTAR